MSASLPIPQPGAVVAARGDHALTDRSANPVDVLEFTWQAPDDLDAFEVDHATDTLSAYIWAGLPGEDPDQIEVLDIADASMHWTVNIPAPGALPLLGVAALAMRRRR